MITVILCAIIGAALYLYSLYKADCFDIFMVVSGVVLCTFIGTFLGVILSFIIPCETHIKETDYEIVSLNDNQNVSGEFFLGCGTIKGEMQYVMYIKKGDGFVLTTVPYYKAKIVYTDNNPTLKELQERPDSKWQWGFPYDLGKKYIIEVPKGTIRNNYKLDAQ